MISSSGEDSENSLTALHQNVNLKIVQAGSAMTWNKDVNLSRRQFCFDLAEMFWCFSKNTTQRFDQGIGTKHIFKEVMEFLNLMKLGVAQCEVVGY